MTDIPHDAESKRKPFNHLAGYVASRHNLINNGWVVIYKAKEAGLDSSGGPWVAVCELHNTLCNTTSLAKARPFLKHPAFCAECVLDDIGEYMGLGKAND